MKPDKMATVAWRPNKHAPDALAPLNPMIDRAGTPRSVNRAITLDRNFSRERWLYNKRTLDAMDPLLAKKDTQRSKLMRRLTKKDEK